MIKTDVLIIGSGPAGYTAGLYTTRAGLNTTLFTGKNIGGQLMYTHEIENFPGYEKISGAELMNIFQKQVVSIGTTIENEQIKSLNIKKYPFEFTAESTRHGEAKAVIIATGSKAKWLNITGEEKFKGQGISVCATCDGFFYRNKIVAVIGGGNTALYEALFLARVASAVYLINNTDKFSGEFTLQKQVFENKKIIVLNNTSVQAFNGNERLESILIYNKKEEKQDILQINGVFEAIGTLPQTELVENQLELTSDGYIKTDKRTMETSVKGVFACGDVQENIYRQAINAAGSGCVAALGVEKFLLHPEPY